MIHNRLCTFFAALRRCGAAGLLVLGLATTAAAGPPTPPAKPSAYLFAYFTGNDKKEEAIRFALSPDGYHYTALNSDRPVINSAAISETGGVRDPHIFARGRWQNVLHGGDGHGVGKGLELEPGHGAAEVHRPD